MSDAGDEPPIDVPEEVEVTTTDAPRGKLSTEEALQVSQDTFINISFPNNTI
jgi:hypothetical protein